MSSSCNPKKYFPYRLYVPENLSIDELLIVYPFIAKKTYKKHNRHRDYLVYVIHLLNSIPRIQKDFDYEQARGFIPINKSILSKRIHDYRLYIDYLKDKGILIEGNSYVVGGRSTGLRFTPDYITTVKAVHINTKTLIKSLISNDQNRDFNAEEKLRFLKRWFNVNLTIDLDRALEFLERDKDDARKKIITKRIQYGYSNEQLNKFPTVDEVVIMGYNSKFITVDIISNSEYRGYPKIDKTTGRLHSPLTQLKKGLRKYLRYNSQKLVNVDIVNSQPLMSLIVLDIEIFYKLGIGNLIARYNPLFKRIPIENKGENTTQFYHNSSYTMLVKMIITNSQKKDVIEFKESIIQGRFYEYFAGVLYMKGLIPQEILSIPDKDLCNKLQRDFAKVATFQAFFEKVYATKWSVYVRAFKECFPNVYAIFQLIKRGKGEHNTLACIFQRFESHLILHKICVDIHHHHPEVPIFTIHDSIATVERHVDTVIHYFQRHIYFALGIEPQLNTEVWE
jgi:hypothetical protein